MIDRMPVSGRNHRRVVVETIEEVDGVNEAPLSSSGPKHWKPGEMHSSLSKKLGATSPPRISPNNEETGVQLPQFFSQSESHILNQAPAREELLDFKGIIDRFAGSLSIKQSIAMSVPVFLTVLVLLTGLAFFAGRFSASESKKATASELPPTIEPVSFNQNSDASPVQGTPDEIIKSVRIEFAAAIEASKDPNQSAAKKDEISKSILHVLDVLGKAISAYPDVASLFFERAQVEKMVMQSAPTLKSQAESDYRKALNLSPLTGQYYIGFADYLDVIGDKKQAMESYEKAVQLEPKNIDALYPLAKLYVEAGRTQQAHGLYAQMIRLLTPGSPQHSQIQQEISGLEASGSATSSAAQTSGN